MPEWLWVLCLFLSLTIGYIVGFMCGTFKSESEINRCPSENAYIREAEIMADANVRIETRRAELEQQTEIEKYKIIAEQVKEETRHNGNML